MPFTHNDRLFVLTGSGISAESGLATFRGSGGLWNGYRVEEVATPEAWTADPELVWRFYSMRRRDALAAHPNAAHIALAEIEREDRRQILSLHSECRRPSRARRFLPRSSHARNPVPVALCALRRALS